MEGETPPSLMEPSHMLTCTTPAPCVPHSQLLYWPFLNSSLTPNMIHLGDTGKSQSAAGEPSTQ